MALWGVSRSDVTNNGWNTVVGVGVVAGCVAAALVVKTIAAKCFATWNKKPSDTEKSKHAFYSSTLGAAAGLAATAALCYFIPGSRFALITDDSISKMFKLGAAQAVSGFVIDYFANSNYIATIVGLGGAVATRFAYPVLGALGAVGAGLGSGLIPIMREKGDSQ